MLLLRRRVLLVLLLPGGCQPAIPSPQEKAGPIANRGKERRSPACVRVSQSQRRRPGLQRRGRGYEEDGVRPAAMDCQQRFQAYSQVLKVNLQTGPGSRNVSIKVDFDVLTVLYYDSHVFCLECTLRLLSDILF